MSPHFVFKKRALNNQIFIILNKAPKVVMIKKFNINLKKYFHLENKFFNKIL